MKKIIGLMLVICTLSLAKAQTNNFESSRKVSTRRYAEREVTRDIVYISSALREYFVDGDTKKKGDSETLEKQRYDAALYIGVKIDDFNVQNVYSHNYDSCRKTENTQLLQ